MRRKEKMSAEKGIDVTTSVSWRGRPTPHHPMGNKTLYYSPHTCDRYTCHRGQTLMCSNSNHTYYIEFVLEECKGQLLILRSLQIV